MKYQIEYFNLGGELVNPPQRFASARRAAKYVSELSNHWRVLKAGKNALYVELEHNWPRPR